MKDYDELEMLLDEIPHATSPDHSHNNNNNHHVSSRVTKRMNDLIYHHMMVDDNDESSSIKCKYMFAASSSPVTASGFPLTSDDSPSSGGRSHSSSPPQYEPHFISSDYGIQTPNEIHSLDISRNFSKMSISHQQSLNRGDFGRFEASGSYRNGGFSPYDHISANLLGSQYSNTPAPARRWFYTYPMEFVLPNAPLSNDDNPPPPSVNHPLFYPPSTNLQFGASSSTNVAPPPRPRMPHYNDVNLIHYQQSVSNGRSVRARGSVDSMILQGQGEGISYKTTRNARSRGHNTKSSFHQENNNNSAWKTQQDKRPQFHNACPFNRSWKFSSLAEAQGYIYHIAKDQQGCRFLQRMFDEGTSRDLHIIFNDIIDHAVELMMSQFGNYLMQKLLEVCTEDQKMNILFRVTAEPGELARISLNTYGTRVVQKLIETLKTKQQISMVVSALEPGFLALIKTLNGSHVIKRCLECFPSEDSKFIFVAAAKYCVDIATHQHGCCALQNCIDHSTGEHREKFVTEISANGLLLAEDAYGNYVVQFILEKIPYATSKLISQFEGNYVNLSTQKFSSHVIEKCLSVCNEEARARIIHELLSASCFDQLLQDPHANYVIQTALKVSEGHIHNSLVGTIMSYKAVSRNSPYSKRIFSQKLFKGDA